MGYADHLPITRWLHCTGDRGIPLQGHVGTTGVIILEIRGHESAQVCLVKDNNPIEEFPAQGPDHPFHVGILPGRERGGGGILDAHARDPMLKGGTVNRIAVTDQVARGCIKGKGFHNLLRRPLSCGMLGHVEVDDLAAIMEQHQKTVEQAKRQRRYREEVDGSHVRNVIREQGSPGMRGRFALLWHLLRHGRLSHAIAQEA
jgi:hypothetical protein